MIFDEDFEGGSNGANITTGNTIFTFVGATPPTFSDAQVKHGSLACSVDPTATTPFEYVHGSSVTNAFMRTYLWINAHPTTVQAFYLCRDTATNAGLQLRIQTNGTLQVRSLGATQTVTSTAQVATGQWVRIETRLTAGASGTGSMEVRLFNDPDSVTPTETISHNAWDGIAAPQTWRLTRINDVTSFFLDGFAGADDDWIGPVSGGGEPEEFTSGSQVVQATVS